MWRLGQRRVSASGDGQGEQGYKAGGIRQFSWRLSWRRAIRSRATAAGSLFGGRRIVADLGALPHLHSPAHCAIASALCIKPIRPGVAGSIAACCGDTQASAGASALI